MPPHSRRQGHGRNGDVILALSRENEQVVHGRKKKKCFTGVAVFTRRGQWDGWGGVGSWVCIVGRYGTLST